MLKNAYLLAKIGADTVENEQHVAKILPKTGNYPTGPPNEAGARRTHPGSARAWSPQSARGRPPRAGRRSGCSFSASAVRRGVKRPVGQLPIFGKFSAKCCSFLAGSAPIFASKYVFCSIFQDLQDYLADIF